MKVFVKRFKLGLDIVLMLLSLSKLIFNAKDISPIFKARSFTDHKAFQQTLASMLADAETAELIRTRYLSHAPADLDALGQLPEGTLGEAFARHMRTNNLKVVFYPEVERTADNDIAYLRLRARQTHDIHHVVLGMPTNELGEMMISAFYLSQDRVPLSALLIGFGFIHAILREPHRIDDLMAVIQYGWSTGKQAKRKFMGVKWEEYWDRPIAEVRQLVGVTPPEFAPGFPMAALANLEDVQPALVLEAA